MFMIRMAVISLGALFLPAAAYAAIHVKLAVNFDSNPPSLIVVSNDSRCTDGPEDCIEVSRGSSPNIFFDLDKACGEGGPNYELQQIRIAMAEKYWPSGDNPLPQYVADDFYADPYNGVIDLVGGDDGKNSLKGDRIKLKDNNSSAYTVFYEITARQCDGDGFITLDPAVNNNGK